MRIVALLLATAGVLATSMSVATAQDYAYCKQGRNSGYPGDCSFTSYAQCQATASGTDEGCGLNPRFAYGQGRGGNQAHGFRSF